MKGKAPKVYKDQGSPWKWNVEVVNCKGEVPKAYTNKEVLENEVVESLIKMGSPKKCTQTRKSLKMKGEVPKVYK